MVPTGTSTETGQSGLSRFTALRSLTRTVIVMACVTLAVSTLGHGLHVLLVKLHDGHRVTVHDKRDVRHIMILAIVCAMITFSTYVTWFQAAMSNVAALGGSYRLSFQAMAAHWLIPGVNWYFPYRDIIQLYEASNPNMTADQLNAFKSAVRRWAFWFIAAVVTSVHSYLLRYDHYGDWKRFCVRFALYTTIFGMFAILRFRRVLQDVEKLQEAQHTAKQDAARFDNW